MPNTQSDMLEWLDTDLKPVTITKFLEIRVRTLATNGKLENFKSISYLKSENSKTTNTTNKIKISFDGLSSRL